MKRKLGSPLGHHGRNDIPSLEYRLLPNGDKAYVIVFHKLNNQVK